MDISDDITFSDFQPGKALIQLVDKKWPAVLCLFPGFDHQAEDFQKARLIISAGELEQLIDTLTRENVPEYTPILYLLGEDRIPDTSILSNSERTIDFLGLPVSQNIFSHRLSFLTRVQKLAVENHTHTVTFNKQLNALYSRDGLTGLFNRRHLTRQLSETFKLAQEADDELSLLIFNIDYFNNINKSSGLEFGDLILNEIAARLTENTRDIDTCYRFSGEDFVVLMPGADEEQALATAEKISRACCKKPYSDGNNTTSITISAGIASLVAHMPENHDNFIFMAENALFLAKAGGRNQIQVYAPPGNKGKNSLERPLTFWKDKLSRILEKTRTSAIASLQLLAKNVAGPEHKTHIASVSHYVGLLGKQLGLSNQHIHTFQNSITLYNSFRALLYNDLLKKPGRLTSEERKTMQDLPFKITELTDLFDYFSEERKVLLSLAEKYDGSGYPHGLKSNEIPLGARIFNIVDSLAAMNAERPYRKRLSHDEIIRELTKEAGKQFDPFLVLQLLSLIKKHKLLDVEPEIIDQSQNQILKNFSEFTP